MPQDKRLIITKAVVHKLQRLREGNTEAAATDGIFIEFTVPAVVVSQCPELLSSHVFYLPKRTYLTNSRTTCLIVPRLISKDAFKINKRHGYYDAVVTAEAICKRDDAEAARRAVQVAKTFFHFVVDARIVSKLPPAIIGATTASNVETSTKTGSHAFSLTSQPVDPRDKKSGADKNNAVRSTAQVSSLSRLPRKFITPLHDLDDRGSLTFRLSQGAVGEVLRAKQPGNLFIRVGHGAMCAGDVCENAKSFIFALKKDFPTVWKYIYEFKMTSVATEPIRFMEVQISR